MVIHKYDLKHRFVYIPVLAAVSIKPLKIANKVVICIVAEWWYLDSRYWKESGLNEKLIFQHYFCEDYHNMNV